MLKDKKRGAIQPAGSQYGPSVSLSAEFALQSVPLKASICGRHGTARLPAHPSCCRAGPVLGEVARVTRIPLSVLRPTVTVEKLGWKSDKGMRMASEDASPLKLQNEKKKEKRKEKLSW